MSHVKRVTEKSAVILGTEKHQSFVFFLMGLGTVIHFSASTVCFHPFGHFSLIRLPCSKSNNLLLSPSTTPTWRIRLKPTPLSLYLSLMATQLQFSQGAPSEDLGASLSLAIGHHDLLIVGPGVLGRLVAQKWRQVLLHIYLLSPNLFYLTICSSGMCNLYLLMIIHLFHVDFV